jgi:hypothetical protein
MKLPFRCAASRGTKAKGISSQRNIWKSGNQKPELTRWKFQCPDFLISKLKHGSGSDFQLESAAGKLECVRRSRA